MNIAYSDKNKIDSGLSAPSVPTYSAPNSVYGSIDSTIIDAVSVYTRATSRPSDARIRRDTQRMRPQMRSEHETFVAKVTTAYASATLIAVPLKKSAFGLPEK